MTARDVIADVAFEGTVFGAPIRFEMGYNKADAILAALDKAGYAPPLLKGAIHKALQDAFQFGVEMGKDMRVVKEPFTWLINRKHRYCDKELERLTAAKETT